MAYTGTFTVAWHSRRLEDESTDGKINPPPPFFAVVQSVEVQIFSLFFLLKLTNWRTTPWTSGNRQFNHLFCSLAAAVLPACLALWCWHVLVPLHRKIKSRLSSASRHGCPWVLCFSLFRSHNKTCNKSISELGGAEQLSGHEWHTWSSNQ